MFDMSTRMRMAGELFAENVHVLEEYGLDELKGAISVTKNELRRTNSSLNAKDRDGAYMAKQLTENLIYYVMRIKRLKDFKNLSKQDRDAIIGNLEYREHKRAAKFLNSVVRGKPIVSGSHIAYNVRRLDIDRYDPLSKPDMSSYVSRNVQKYLATSPFKK